MSHLYVHFLPCFTIFTLHFNILDQTTASEFSHFFNVCRQQTFRHSLIERLLLSTQNFDGCVEVPAVDTMSEDDKSAINIGVCNPLNIAEDIEDFGVAVRQAQCCLSYVYTRLGNCTNV